MTPIPKELSKSVPKGATHMSETFWTCRSGGEIQVTFYVYKFDEEKGWLRYYRDGDNEYPEWVRAKI